VQPALHDAHVGVAYSKSAAVSESQEADAAKLPWILIAGAIDVAVLGHVSGRAVEASLRRERASPYSVRFTSDIYMRMHKWRST
jgi:hypothetical protein